QPAGRRLFLADRRRGALVPRPARVVHGRTVAGVLHGASDRLLPLATGGTPRVVRRERGPPRHLPPRAGRRGRDRCLPRPTSPNPQRLLRPRSVAGLEGHAPSWPAIGKQ